MCTKLAHFLQKCKSTPYFEAIMMPQDALEFFEALALAQSQIDPAHLCGPKVSQALLRLDELKSFFALYYIDFLEEGIDYSEVRISS